MQLTHSNLQHVMLREGTRALSNAQLLAVFLQTIYHPKDALEVAEIILKDTPLPELWNTSMIDFAKMEGIGLTTASQFVALRALCERAHAESTRTTFVVEVYRKR